MRRLWRPLVGFVVASAVVLGVGAASAQESGAVPRGAEGAVVAPPEKDSAPKPGVKPPELVEFVHAEYPKAAFEQGLQASVGLKLTVNTEGAVTAVEVTEPAGHGFDEAASAAAMKFRYTPATRDGRPFAVKIPYVYRFTITLVEQPAPPPPTRGNLTGELRIAGSDAPLVNLPVLVKLPDGSERSLTTDATGRFRLDDVPPGTARLTVSIDGFEPVTSDESVVVGEETDVTLRLMPKSDGLEIIVRGERPPREVTRRTVERREMERIPGTSGDALRSLQNLPGVARPPGLAGLLIVRGSGPQDTVTFVDGVDVPIIYHFFGLTSVIPTELLDRIDFFPGNFSARYGRVGGGIVDARLRSPDTRCYSIDGKLDPTRTGCFHGLLQMDLVDGRFLLQGPLPLDGWTFAVAGRRSWLDSWLKPVLREAGSSVATAPVYYDYQLIADRRTDTSQTSLRFFGSDDRMALIINDPLAQDPAFGGNLRFGTAFYRAQFLHESELNSVVSLSTSVAVGKDMADFQLGNFFFNFQSLALLWRYELGFKLFRGAKLNLGLDFQGSDYEVNVRLPAPPRPGEPDPGPFVLRPPLESHQSGFGFRPAWYGELELEPFDRLRIVPGLRADYYRDANHGDLAPRVSGRYDLVKGAAEDAPARRRTTLKAGAGLFYQPPEYQETDEVFGTPDLLSNRAAHYTLGIEQELTRQIDVSVEGFYKDFSQLVSRRSDLSSATGYVYANEGDGHAMGLETLLKYKPDERFFGWVAYTLSRSVRRDNPDEPEHLFQYDQTHNLIMLGSYRLGRGWEFGARFRLVSGALVTPLVPRPSLPAIYAADAGSYVPIEGRPYSRRLPLFHQLDLRIDKRWQLKRARLSAYLDVQNVYNNPTAEQLIYNFDFSKSSYQTGLPIIPSLGFRLEI
jgi:TonB family protein